MSNPFDRNPFRLPPPWNAGYALPENVDDEGLERHAYTTAWAPRGSYDDPKVGYAGYAVPGYVKDEGYGRGAMITRWAQRGTYYGPKVKHWLDKPSAKIVGVKQLPDGAAQVKIETLAGIEMALNGNGKTPLTTYGLTVATGLIDTVKMMPPAERKKQLRLALDRIDPELYRRAEGDADKEAKLGVPADIALKRGLGAAVSYGLAKELVDLGKGKRPGKRSLLGNAACMGEDTMMTLRTSEVKPSPIDPGLTLLLSSALQAKLMPVEMETVPAHWERASSSRCVPGSQPPPGVAQPSGGTAPEGYCWVPASTQPKVAFVPSALRPPAPPPPDQVFANIGPFLIPVNVGAWRDHRTLTAEKKAYVDENVATAAKAGGISISEMEKGRYPFVKFKAGMNGEESWGLYYTKGSDGSTTVAYHKIPASEAEALGGVISSIGGALKDAASYVGGAIWSVLKKIWAGIKWVVMKVVHFVVDATKWVAKMTCKLHPASAVQAAQAVAAAAPNPYTIAVAAGATVTKMICDKVYGSDSEEAAAAAEAEAAAAAAAAAAEAEAARKRTTTLLLLGGAGVAAYLLFGRKKA